MQEQQPQPQNIAGAGAAPQQLPNIAPNAPPVDRSELERLETAFIQTLDAIADVNIKKELKDRFTESQNFAKHSNLSHLSDYIDEKKPEKGTQLDSRQQSTKDFFSKKLENDQQQQRAIVAELEAIHAMRLRLLTQTVNNERQASMDKAYEAFNGRMNRVSPGVTARAAGAPPLSNLENDLRQSENRTLTSSDNKIVITFTGENHATSNDPVALGLAMAAKGFRKATFSGDPKEALLAAQTAFANGVEKVEIDQKTLDLAERYRNARTYFKGPEDYAQFHRELQALKDRMTAKDSQPNSAFNSTTSSLQEAVSIFGNLDETAHRQMLLNMIPEKQAELAYNLKGQYVRNGVQMDGHDYVQAILKDVILGQVKPVEAFDRYYKLLQQLNPKNKEILKNMQNPNEAADFIMKVNDAADRRAYYNFIDELGTEKGTQDQIDKFRNDVKTICLGRIQDKEQQKSAGGWLASRAAHQEAEADRAALRGNEPGEEDDFAFSNQPRAGA